MIIELLQAVGLNKYESEAYASLLRHGPMTGYELGKRSGVPLSRSYEILERLASKGLALAQPGDPPRYAAEAPEQFLERTQRASQATFAALAQSFADLAQARPPDGFWVVRSQDAILAHARTLIGRARRTLSLSIAPAHQAGLEPALEQARGRGLRVALAPPPEAAEHLLLTIDDQEGMAGTLAPAEDCQAVASANQAFVTLLRRFFKPQAAFAQPPGIEPPRPAQPLEWLDWEQRKQRRLLDTQPRRQVA